MQIAAHSGPLEELVADWLIVPCFDRTPLGPRAELPAETREQISRAHQAEPSLGKLGHTTVLYCAEPTNVGRVMLLGLGHADELTAVRIRRGFGTAAKKIAVDDGQSVGLMLPEPVAAGRFVQEAADALTVGCVGQDVYRSRRKLFAFTELTLVDQDAEKHLRAAGTGHAIGNAVNLTRDLVNRMPGEIHPIGFASRAEQIADRQGLQCRVFDEAELEAESMNAFLAVSHGSRQPARMVVLEYFGGQNDGREIALVGKGVTFDSGGLSLKPHDSMKTMKCDMAGAATVLGAMSAIARLKLPFNVIGFMGLAENMLGGAAMKPGDVLTARNGTTIEVLNTDAEGRLVLADMLAYAVDRGADRIIDLATLTGACVVALGEDVTGVFTNRQPWCEAVLQAARNVGEDVWQMPMFDLFDEQIEGDVSDIKNIGPRWGGAITAAKFLERFVSEKPWVHLDIAGPSFAESAKPHRDGGATGCMVRTLIQLVAAEADAAANG